MSAQTHGRESLRAVDAAWLRMDSDTNPMVITSVLVFDPALKFADVEKMVRERLLPHERFRQRVTEGRLHLGTPAWELDPEFDLRAHLHHVALPEPRDQDALEDMVSDLMSTKLDRRKPLWQMHVVDGFEDGTAVVVRLHHCIGDGVALIGLLFGLTDEGEGMTVQQVGVLPKRAHHPIEHAKLAAEQTRTLGKLLLLPADPHTSLKGELTSQKRAAWSSPVALDTVKEIARRAGGKVNDVLLGAAAGALRAHLLEHGGLPNGEIRALVPVFLRGISDKGELGNHFGLVFLSLPIGLADPFERLSQIKQRMDVIKASPEASVALGVLGAMGVASSEMERIGVDIFTRKASVMMTNVPGPPMPLHLAGHELRSMMVWAPVAGHIGLGISLLSYAGGIRLGAAADSRRIADPRGIVRAFEQEIETLRNPSGS